MSNEDFSTLLEAHDSDIRYRLRRVMAKRYGNVDEDIVQSAYSDAALWCERHFDPEKSKTPQSFISFLVACGSRFLSSHFEHERPHRIGGGRLVSIPLSVLTGAPEDEEEASVLGQMKLSTWPDLDAIGIEPEDREQFCADLRVLTKLLASGDAADHCLAEVLKACYRCYDSLEEGDSRREAARALIELTSTLLHRTDDRSRRLAAFLHRIYAVCLNGMEPTYANLAEGVSASRAGRQKRDLQQMANTLLQQRRFP